MDFDHDKFHLFQRRSILIGAFKGLLLSAVLGRMFYLQVIEGQKYKTMAEKNRISVRPISPGRGLIVDLKEEILARNDQNFSAFFLREKTDDVEKSLSAFVKLLHLTDGEQERIRRFLKSRKKFLPVLLKENLTWEQVAKIQFAMPHLPGIFIDVGEIRSYPYKGLLAHLLGYVGSISPEEQKKNPDPIYTIPGMKIGRSGIESAFDNQLRGTPGAKQLEVNALGRVVRELAHDPGKIGKKVQLTIHLGLQQRIGELLQEHQSGSCVVMDAQTGAVYGCVSHPGYDPNLFVGGISDASWKQFLEDPARPLTNKVIAGQYAPGSIFKMTIALAALEHNAVNKNHQVFCKGYIDYGNHRFHCVHKHGCGTVNFHRAIQKSCDTFFYDLGGRLSIDQIAKTARMLGYGQKYDLGLTGESPGLIPDKAWKIKKHGVPWVGGDTINASIGQGYILVTPLQIAVMTARFANGGKAVTPYFVRQVDNELVHPLKFPELDFNPEHLDIIVDGMKAVVQPDGTGKHAFIEDPSFQMGGKTATTQVKRISMEDREKGLVGNEHRPWHHRDHAMFTCFGPTDNPRYALAIIVDHGGFGGSVAAPLAKKIMLACKEFKPAELV